MPRGSLLEKKYLYEERIVTYLHEHIHTYVRRGGSGAFRLDDKSRSSMSPFLRRSISSCSFYFTIMLYPSKLIARRVRSLTRARAYIPRRGTTVRSVRETIHRGNVCYGVRANLHG